MKDIENDENNINSCHAVSNEDIEKFVYNSESGVSRFELPSFKEDYDLTSRKIIDVLESIKKVLLKKNELYGNSALEPLGVFSKIDANNSICIRLDDKLNRVKNSKELRKNDIADIIGYLILLCIDKNWTDFMDLID